MYCLSGPTLVLFALGLCFLLPLSSAQDHCEEYEGFECEKETPRASFWSWTAEDPEPDCGTNLVETTLKLFKEGDKVIAEQFEHFGDRTEAVLMIGKTGTGKSTLTYFIAGNDSAMISFDDGYGGKRITDCNGKIGESVIVSKTTFPELVIDPKTSAAFFDYPGFFDTRAACVEIANAYFMLTVARQTPKAKIAIVVEHSAVNGGNKGSFKETLESVINFIPNIELYSGAIGLVATKVVLPNSDDQVAGYIRKYIGDVKVGLNETLSGDKLRKAIFIIDEMVVDGRIGVFKTPTDCGPLSDIPQMQANKATLTNVILNNLQYVNTKPQDFNMSLSGNAQLELVGLTASLTSGVANSLDLFKQDILSSLTPQFSCPHLEDCYQLLPGLQSLYANPIFVKGFEYLNFWEGATFSEMISNATSVFSSFPTVSLNETLLKSLELDTGYLDFIQDLNADNKIDVSQWIIPLEAIKREVTAAVKETLKNTIDSSIAHSVESLFTEIYEDLVANFHTVDDVLKQQNILANLSEKTDAVVASIQTELTSGMPLSNFVWNTIDNCITLGLSSASANVAVLKIQSRFVDFFEISLGQGNLTPAEQTFWLTNYRDFLASIRNEYDWSKFLISLFSDLSTIQIQVENRYDLKGWWSTAKPFKYTTSNSANLESFYTAFKDVTTVQEMDKSKIVSILEKDGPAKVQSLNLLLATTLESTFSCTDSGGTLSCQGNFVSLKEVRQRVNIATTKNIVVQSFHTVYVDNEFNGAELSHGSNLNLVILAPTWVTTGKTINLAGATGTTLSQVPGTGTGQGAAGGVGSNAGNFYGIGQMFPEGHPTVTVSGGAGGTGQKGQTGADGSPGSAKEIGYSTGDWIYEPDCEAWASDWVRLNNKYRPYTCDEYVHEDGSCEAPWNGVEYKLEGSNGGAGGAGGAGGKAGLGGLGGKYFLNLVDSGKSMDSNGEDGGTGGVGSGGTGGVGGKKGDYVKIRIDNYYNAAYYDCKVLSKVTEYVSTRAGNGSNGASGGSSSAQVQPTPTVPAFDSAAVALKYKAEFESAALAIQKNMYFKTPLSEFVEKMKNFS